MTSTYLRAIGCLAEADIADHQAGTLTTAAFVNAASLTYYHSKASAQDAEGYRDAIEQYLGFPLPVREDWTIAQWTELAAVRRRAAATSNGKHRPIYN